MNYFTNMSKAGRQGLISISLTILCYLSLAFVLLAATEKPVVKQKIILAKTLDQAMRFTNQMAAIGYSLSDCIVSTNKIIPCDFEVHHHVIVAKSNYIDQSFLLIFKK